MVGFQYAQVGFAAIGHVAHIGRIGRADGAQRAQLAADTLHHGVPGARTLLPEQPRIGVRTQSLRLVDAR